MARNRFSVDLSVNAKMSRKDLWRVRKKLWKKMNQILSLKNVDEQMAKLGQNVAKQLAPYERGYAIKSIRTRSRDANTSEVYIDDDILGNNPTNRGDRPFNYVQYMHVNDGKMGRGYSNNKRPVKIKSGDPQFMWTAQKIVKDKIGETIRMRLSK